jgi:hypothetical protein
MNTNFFIFLICGVIGVTSIQTAIAADKDHTAAGSGYTTEEFWSLLTRASSLLTPAKKDKEKKKFKNYLIFFLNTREGKELINARRFELTPLMWVVLQGWHEFIAPLLSKGANINMLSPEGHTALSLAIRHANTNNASVKMINIFLEYTPPITLEMISSCRTQRDFAKKPGKEKLHASLNNILTILEQRYQNQARRWSPVRAAWVGVVMQAAAGGFKK